MTAYPISLSTTALLVLIALLYYHPSRRIESARALNKRPLTGSYFQVRT